jgi:tRNA (Thr-GGU) A37 N-methylase
VPEGDKREGGSTTIGLDPDQFNAEASPGLDQFSCPDIIFVFDQAGADDITYGARHPRGRTDWPNVGIFAQLRTRSPNRIGVSVCRTTPVSGFAPHVQDTIDGTPVLDIKPVTTGFRPRGGVKEPDRAREIMERYWQ